MQKSEKERHQETIGRVAQALELVIHNPRRWTQDQRLEALYNASSIRRDVVMMRNPGDAINDIHRAFEEKNRADVLRFYDAFMLDIEQLRGKDVAVPETVIQAGVGLLAQNVRRDLHNVADEEFRGLGGAALPGVVVLPFLGVWGAGFSSMLVPPLAPLVLGAGLAGGAASGAFAVKKMFDKRSFIKHSGDREISELANANLDVMIDRPLVSASGNESLEVGVREAFPRSYGEYRGRSNHEMAETISLADDMLAQNAERRAERAQGFGK